MKDRKYPDWVGKKITTTDKGYDILSDPDMQKWADERGVKVQCVVIGKDGIVFERVLIEDGMPIFSSEKLEDVATHIDIISLREKFS